LIGLEAVAHRADVDAELNDLRQGANALDRPHRRDDPEVAHVVEARLDTGAERRRGANGAFRLAHLGEHEDDDVGLSRRPRPVEQHARVVVDALIPGLGLRGCHCRDGGRESEYGG
jgi:hypothetical protein